MTNCSIGEAAPTSYELTVRVSDSEEARKLLDHVCADHTEWSWNDSKDSLWKFRTAPNRTIIFTGDKSKSTAIHFKLVYQEPPEPRVRFLDDINSLYPFSMGAGSGKSNMAIWAAGRAAGKSAMISQIFKDQIRAYCVMSDHEVAPSIESFPKDSQREFIESLIGVQRGTQPTPFANAIAASGLKKPESK